MCGISGIYSLNGEPISTADISAQIETLVHRGPNQGGVYVSPDHRCGLGIRRLSIIDVVGGQQPLHNEDESVHLVYNGETYNYQALRCELEVLGHCPGSRSDAEVVLHGYEAWGAEGVLPRMRGMAAFALWDEKQQQLFIGRDRFGIKPLYYAQHAGRLYFASEIKAIVAQPTFPRKVNLTALQAMLTLGFTPGPQTMFKGIYKLPPAHFLLARNGSFQTKKYWQLEYQADHSISEDEAAEQFLALLREAVQIRLMSEVPLGALLSGGLDSGALVALVSEQLSGAGHQLSVSSEHLSVSSKQFSVRSKLSSLVTPRALRATSQRLAVSGQWSAAGGHNLKTVSIGFEQPGYDEAALALDLADFIGTEHHPISLTQADFDAYPVMMQHLETPQCSATAVPIYKLYQACRQVDLTVVLTGEGADELLGGYYWHRGDALVRPLLALPETLRRALAAAPLPMSAAARRVLSRGARDIPSRYRDWLEIGGEGYWPRLLSAEVSGALSHNGGQAFLNDWAEKLLDQQAAPLHQTLWLEAQTRLVDFINFEVDKMSMAHSIEARVPFLDHKLWEFCAMLPPHYKLKGRTEKYLLRRATKNLLPEATRTRRKKGLAAPYAHWLRAERLPAWAETALSPQTIKETGLFDPATVQALRRAHRAGQPNLGALLMGVLSTQVWFNGFSL